MNKSIPAEMLIQILDSISYAPFGAESEKVNVTIINNRKKIESALPYIADFLDNIVIWIDNPIASYMIKREKGLETFNTIKNHFTEYRFIMKVMIFIFGYAITRTII